MRRSLKRNIHTAKGGNYKGHTQAREVITKPNTGTGGNNTPINT